MKEKFDSAHEVQQKKNRGRRMLLPRFQRFKPHTDTDLVYLRPSSDYCEFDVKKGSLGTHGRECDPVSKLILISKKVDCYCSVPKQSRWFKAFEGIISFKEIKNFELIFVLFFHFSEVPASTGAS